MRAAEGAPLLHPITARNHSSAVPPTEPEMDAKNGVVFVAAKSGLKSGPARLLKPAKPVTACPIGSEWHRRFERWVGERVRRKTHSGEAAKVMIEAGVGINWSGCGRRWSECRWRRIE